MMRRLIYRHQQGQHNADGNRHIHIQAAGAKGAQCAQKKRLTGKGGHRQRNQCGKPVKEIPRFGAHDAGITRPYGDRQQHDIHGAKGRNGEAEQQPFHLARFLAFHRTGIERIGAIADSFQFSNEARRINAAKAPFHMQAAVGIIDPGLFDAGQVVKRGFNFGDTGGAGNILDGKIHHRAAITIAANIMAIIAGLIHGLIQRDAVMGDKHGLSALAGLKIQRPATRSRLKLALIMARRILNQHDLHIAAHIGGCLQLCHDIEA